jgi:hypothetical protein
MLILTLVQIIVVTLHHHLLQVLLPEAGHFEYLDAASPLQKAVCPGGSTPADQVGTGL